MGPQSSSPALFEWTVDESSVRSRTVCTRAGGLGDVGLLTPGVGHARSVATNVSGYWLGLRKDDVPPT